jgi:transposase
VISVEAWTTIRYLHAQGTSMRAIAQQLGLARNTVRTAIRATSPPTHTRSKRVNPQLAPYTAQIAQMLVEHQFIGSRMLRELRRLGYRGGATAVYTSLAQLQAERARPQAVERFETAPGEQAQFDWSPSQVQFGERTQRVIVFGLILSYSRRKFSLASLDETQGSVFAALEAGFAYFGGVVKRVLVDNAKVLVSDARPATCTWNQRFLEWCGHYQLEPVACQVRRPQTKGKIERPFFSVEQHFMKGGCFRDRADLHQQLARFQREERDLLVHRTTQERPGERFVAEQPTLRALPTTHCRSSLEAVRKVSLDCLVSYGGSRYSVPHEYATKQVWVRAVLGSRLDSYSQAGALLATHEVAPKQGSLCLDQAHYTGLRQRSPLTKVIVSAAFLARFPDQQPFLEGLLHAHPTGPATILRAILALAASYPDTALWAAFAHAVEQQCYTLPFIRGLVEQHTPRVEPPQRLPVVFATIPTQPVTRSLAVYQRLLEGEKA